MPDLLFMDVDKAIPFGGHTKEEILDMVLNATIHRLKEKLQDNDVSPTVLWSGNGYHVIQPVEPLSIPLESDAAFEKFSNLEPSKQFLSFAEQAITNEMADPSHRPTFRSCMLRVPYSYNSKCLNAGRSKEDSLVKVKQRWNGYRPKLRPLLIDFYTYLTDMQIHKAASIKHQISKFHSTTKKVIPWIDRLLQTGQTHYRRYTLDMILIPYLITVKGLDSNQTLKIVKDWLARCATTRPLEYSNSKYDDRIDRALERSIEKKWKPLSLDKLQEVKPKLYQMLLPVINQSMNK